MTSDRSPIRKWNSFDEAELHEGAVFPQTRLKDRYNAGKFDLPRDLPVNLASRGLAPWKAGDSFHLVSAKAAFLPLPAPTLTLTLTGPEVSEVRNDTLSESSAFSYLRQVGLLEAAFDVTDLSDRGSDQKNMFVPAHRVGDVELPDGKVRCQLDVNFAAESTTGPVLVVGEVKVSRPHREITHVPLRQLLPPAWALQHRFPDVPVRAFALVCRDFTDADLYEITVPGGVRQVECCTTVRSLHVTVTHT